MAWSPESPSGSGRSVVLKESVPEVGRSRFPTVGGEAASGVVILGMSRSGTSAVASVFAAAGCYCGPASALLRPNWANPRGYFERREIVEFNDQILNAAGTTWFQPLRPGSGYEPDAVDRDRARVMLDGVIAEAWPLPVVLKDPRIGLLLDLWMPLLAGRFAPVLVVRNPLEVAASLAARDGSPLPFALAAWELHMAEILRRLRDSRVTVAPYAALTTPAVVERVVADATAVLEPGRRRRIDPAAGAAGFARGGRRNAVAADAFTDEETLSSRQVELWRWLQGLRPEAQTLAVPEELLVDRVAAGALTDSERTRLEMVEQIAVQGKLLLGHEREIERLRALVHSEQLRLQAEVDAANVAMLEQRGRDEREIVRLRVVVRSEQARLESQVRELREMLETSALRSEP